MPSAQQQCKELVAAADLAFFGGFSTAVLISQRVIGAKGFGR